MAPPEAAAHTTNLTRAADALLRATPAQIICQTTRRARHPGGGALSKRL